MNRTNSFFHHPEAILMEIALGATMAGATTLEMNLRGAAFLDIHDDRPLKTDDDAWFNSFLQLMVASETITFTDRLGTVTVDCVRYFSDEEYRARVFKKVKAPKAVEGFHLPSVARGGYRRRHAQRPLLVSPRYLLERRTGEADIPGGPLQGPHDRQRLHGQPRVHKAHEGMFSKGARCEPRRRLRRLARSACRHARP